mmetsp:Transcript_20343/g.54759  ORF Transcript_20343/g.54759 Transcript_20343/m.54759 type:complete len:215 (-) Transcript_20343:1075-1719(-)
MRPSHRWGRRGRPALADRRGVSPPSAVGAWASSSHSRQLLQSLTRSRRHEQRLCVVELGPVRRTKDIRALVVERGACIGDDKDTAKNHSTVTVEGTPGSCNRDRLLHRAVLCAPRDVSRHLLREGVELGRWGGLWVHGMDEVHRGDVSPFTLGPARHRLGEEVEHGMGVLVLVGPKDHLHLGLAAVLTRGHGLVQVGQERARGVLVVGDVKDDA